MPQGNVPDNALTGPALAAINRGQPVYYDPTNKGFWPCSNDTAVHADAVGIALNAAAVGGTVYVAPAGAQVPISLLVDVNNNSLIANVTATNEAWVGAAGVVGNKPAGSSGFYSRPVYQIIGSTAVVVYSPVQGPF
jgi:hypothetical protein